jgi:hypothetical protein
MRMWMVNPKIMCQKHLCGEHLEVHMFLSCLKKGKKLDGYLKGNLLEPRSIYQRHLDLSKEMIRRGYNHKSEMLEESFGCIFDLPIEKQYWEINKESALRTLLERCPKCRKRYYGTFTSADSQLLANT